MFIAHLPAGYLLSRQLIASPLISRSTLGLPLLIAGLIGSLFPDIDLLYFYLIDARQHHHHSYWTHLPITWLLLTPLVWLLIRPRRWRPAVLLFGACALLHLLLDSMTGSIAWLCPFDCQGFHLVTVTARHQPWWLNFILHWTFIIELLITLLASVTIVIDRRQRTTASSNHHEL